MKMISSICKLIKDIDMEIKTLNEVEIDAVSGGFLAIATSVGFIAATMAIMEYADEVYQGFTDHRVEE
jgi:hypothetical protein